MQVALDSTEVSDTRLSGSNIQYFNIGESFTVDASTATTEACFHLDSPYIQDLQGRCRDMKSSLVDTRRLYQAILLDFENQRKATIQARIELESTTAELSRANQLTDSLKYALRTTTAGSLDVSHQELQSNFEDVTQALERVSDEVAVLTCERDEACKEQQSLAVTVVELHKRIAQTIELAGRGGDLAEIARSFGLL